MPSDAHAETRLLVGLVLVSAMGCTDGGPAAGVDAGTLATDARLHGSDAYVSPDTSGSQDGLGALGDGATDVSPDSSGSPDGLGGDLGNTLAPDASGSPDGLGSDLGGGADVAEFWTIAVLPDTQSSYYTAPSFFAAETRWIAENRDSEGIAFVLHEGDIVDWPADTNQWTAARANMGLLDGKVPYVLAAGNHDLGSTTFPGITRIDPRSTLMNQYFSFDDFSKASTFGGAFESGHLENAYYLLPAGGRTWVAIALEFSPRPEAIAWADQVLTANATLPAILLTHAYLYSDGQRYDHVGRTCQLDCTNVNPLTSTVQCWNPICYLGDGSDGEMLWNSLVKLHDNILFVFSGHVANPTPFDAARLSSSRPDGTVCHQLMADFQADGTTGGDGYFRLLRIWPDGRVQVRTFSPYVEPARAFLTEDRYQFDLHIQIPGG
jgi:hypothetical protein